MLALASRASIKAPELRGAGTTKSMQLSPPAPAVISPAAPDSAPPEGWPPAVAPPEGWPLTPAVAPPEGWPLTPVPPEGWPPAPLDGSPPTPPSSDASGPEAAIPPAPPETSLAFGSDELEHAAASA